MSTGGWRKKSSAQEPPTDSGRVDRTEQQANLPTNRGFLNEDELSRVWRDCKILLSTAPSEGYGLALRESLLNGTFVVARKNAGTLAAQIEFGYGIHVYRDTDEAVTLIESLIKEAFSAYDIEEIRLQVLKSNKKSLNSLIDSWLRFS